MLTFYFAPGSSSMAPHIALHEIDVPFESRPLSLAKRETRTPAYLALNPEGKVPTLLIDGRPLTEVAAILFYLARRFREANLLPEGDVEAEAQAISWMSFIAATIHPARRQGIDRARAVFGIADRRLGNREWALGRYSIADIHLFRLYWRFRNTFQPAPAEFPSLSAHYDRMMVRPAVQQTCAIEAAIGYEPRPSGNTRGQDAGDERGMTSQRMRPLAGVLAALASAVLYSRCFPPANVAPLAWIALVPFFAAVRSTSLPIALLLTWIFTVGTAYATGDWFPRAISTYYNQPLAVGIGFFFAVSSLLAAPGTILFTLCYRVLARRPWTGLPLLTGAAWVTGEILRSRLTGNPWVLLGYSQVDATTVIQIADVTGIYGVGFILASINAALAELWIAWRARGSISTAVRGAAVAIVPAALAVAYGTSRLSADTREMIASPVRIAVVQGNLDLGSQWRPEFYGENLRTYLELTLGELRQHEPRPTLIIWPENAMCFFLDDEPLYREAIADVLSVGPAQLVAGGPRVVGASEQRFFNSAFLLASDGSTVARYDKTRLLPFAEYFPFPHLDYLRRNFGRVREFSPGTDTPLLPTVAGAAGVAICNEALFPEIVAERTRAGAELLINLSNDSWIPDRKFAEITFNKVRLRAIEQRRYLVRASTSGPSAIVDPFGRVLTRSGVLNRAVITGTVRPLHIHTLYACIGDLFAWLCVASVAVSMIVSILRQDRPFRAA